MALIHGSGNAMQDNSHPAILKTQQWLEKVIIGLNFCPFAKKEFVNNTIHYQVCSQVRLEKALEEFAQQCEYLENNPTIETTLIVYSLGFRNFDAYLDLVDYANELLFDLGFEGVFQIASFHPDYVFDGEDADDAANFTNRSPLPILHLLREESMSKVLSVYNKPEHIPENNIQLAREKGSQFFKQILKQIHRR
ncbi:DUF1415 domain-containing protein [Thalassotalea castellviae]|uniref:DUF1415 domain-containing protein n=1 Tax=Thalassotalea castellviae TaxID=3075612 RepID=A0ABU3A7U6_9GAMM|nr:DUF1415 domain-containing protein [Thalassotalea sp. W431]MDT0605173.1 DUF1415 domain-containing protein [Thalassotalea sp. W431]